MKKEINISWFTIGLAIVLFFETAIFVGCKKQNPPAPLPPETQTNANGSVTAEQTICPVMEGNKIDKNIFVEYKGKKVYFCCEDCKAIFEKSPEKYISKLPQFQN
jgi:YHS domain-containing protein